MIPEFLLQPSAHKHSNELSGDSLGLLTGESTGALTGDNEGSGVTAVTAAHCTAGDENVSSAVAAPCIVSAEEIPIIRLWFLCKDTVIVPEPVKVLSGSGSSVVNW